MRCYIINRNLNHWVKNTVDWCKSRDITPIIIDNNSTYFGTLIYYADQPCKIISFDRNTGPYGIWESGLIDEYENGYYFVTDPDLGFYNLPDDTIDKMILTYEKYKPSKVGLYIDYDRISDKNPLMPDLKNALEKSQLYHKFKNFDDNIAQGDIDTTFALYNNSNKKYINPSWMSDALVLYNQYSITHLPWSIDDTTCINIFKNYLFYLEHTNTHWTATLRINPNKNDYSIFVNFLKKEIKKYEQQFAINGI